MNNARTLERLHGLAQMLPEEAAKDFNYYHAHPETLPTAKKYTDSLALRLALLMADVESELKQEAAKGSGQLARFKAMQRIIKSAKAQPREALHGAWIADGMQCVCDGYRLARLSDPLDLEKIPEKMLPIDAARLIASAKDNNGATLDLPDLGTLRAYIKTEKAAKKAKKDPSPVLYDFGADLPAVNAEYLRDLLEIFPDSTATASQRSPDKLAIYFSSADGDALLMPIRKGA